MGIKFITDSTCDLSAEYLLENNVRLIPMTYLLDDHEYSDSPFGGENTLSRKAFYDAMRAGSQPKTTQINEIVFSEAFEEILESGSDVFYIGFSGGLTGSMNNARRAADALMEKYPQRKVFIVDSVSASMGEGLLVMMGVDALKKGLSGEEIRALLETERTAIQHWFTVEDLVYLKRGGRISSATAVVGTMLNIKPMLTIDDEGHLVPLEKSKGRKKAIHAMMDRVASVVGENDPGDFYLVHSDADEADIELLRAAMVKRFGRDVVSISNMTPVIGAHTGPGLLALVHYAPGGQRPGQYA